MPSTLLPQLWAVHRGQAHLCISKALEFARHGLVQGGSSEVPALTAAKVLHLLASVPLQHRYCNVAPWLPVSLHCTVPQE